MNCRILFILLIALCVSISALAVEVRVDVEVTGLEEQLKANVLARLNIYLQRDNERLQNSGVRMLHRKAEKDIKAALAPFGYYDPVVEGNLTSGAEGWRAVYHVEKGEPVLVDSVAIELLGDGRDERDLRKDLKKFPLKKGSVLDQAIYESGKKKLINRAISLGYLDAKFLEKELRINRSSKVATVQLSLNTGPLYVFGPTSSSQQILKPELLKRYLPYKEGDPYSTAKLYELQTILYKTEYFSDVKAQGLIKQADRQRIPVELELTPPEHKNKYSFGIGYATDTGALGKIGWTNRLINSKGYKASALFQLAELENSVSLSLAAPVKDPRYNKVVGSLDYENKEWDDTATELFSASVSREFSSSRANFSAGLEIRDETYDIGNTSGQGTFLIPSVNLGYSIADDVLYTQKGIQVSAGLRGAVKGAVSDASFLQTTLGGKAIYSPLDRWRVIGRGSLGVTFVDSIDELPPSLRFYAGGDSTIRGYKYKSIGTEDDSGAVIGGRYLVVGSIELERSFGERWSLAGFWDGGTATDDLSLDFYQGVGLGLRFRLPFGQIRFDVASAITEEGYPVRVHLTVGGDL